MTRSAPRVCRTVRLVLRPFTDADRPAFAALNADPVVMAHLPAVLRRDQSDALLDRIRHSWDVHGYGLWALERTDTAELAGFTGLAPVVDAVPIRCRPIPCVEVGWRLGSQHWGNGFATEAGREALRVAFDELGLGEVVSFTAATNRRSQAVMARLGMSRDQRGDFDHPAVATDSPLRPHVLYRIRRPSPPASLAESGRPAVSRWTRY